LAKDGRWSTGATYAPKDKFTDGIYK